MIVNSAIFFSEKGSDHSLDPKVIAGGHIRFCRDVAEPAPRLTQPQTTMLVHFSNDHTEQYNLFQVPQQEEDKK